MSCNRGRIWARTLAGVLCLLAACLTATAADYDSFERIGKFQVLVDGQTDPQARLYHSISPPAFLIVVPGLEDAILLLPGRSQVKAVAAAQVEAGEDQAAIASGAELRSAGEFRVSSDQTVDLQFGGRTVGLRPKPILLGEQSARDLKDYDPLYRRRARDFNPDPSYIRLLQNYQGKAQVRVYFGSWCAFCQANVPKLIKIEEMLKDTGITFDYFGLPRNYNQNQTAVQKNIKQVPTAVVTVDGREVGRIIGTDVQQAAGNLHRMLTR